MYPWLAPGRVGGHGETFDHPVGIVLHHGAVHVGAGVAFVAVGDDVLLVGLRRREQGPFGADRISGPASTAQAGGLDLVDDLGGGHGGQRLVEGAVGPVGDGGLESVGVDDAGVGQHDALLTSEERHVLVEDVGLQRLAFGGVRSDDFRPDLGVDAVVHDLFAPSAEDTHEGTLAAQPHATGRDDPHLRRQAGGGHLGLDRGDGRPGSRRLTAGAGAGLDAPRVSASFFEFSFGDFVEVDGSSHQLTSSTTRVEVSMRASVDSASWWPATSPSYTTTGASPHDPRQRAVRKVRRPSSDVSPGATS